MLYSSFAIETFFCLIIRIPVIHEEIQGSVCNEKWKNNSLPKLHSLLQQSIKFHEFSTSMLIVTQGKNALNSLQGVGVHILVVEDHGLVPPFENIEYVPMFVNVKGTESVVMAVPQTPPSSPHLYPQELQLKLYQAFIFSIPILFSIILVLLFYLFYLKRRASSLSSSPPLHILPTTANPQTTYPYPSSPCRLDLTVQFLDKLPRILFDEDLRTGDSVCCVCLGEFEVKEEVLQIPQCKHVFHINCIRNWLQSHSTCPLCRCSIIPSSKYLSPAPIIASDPPQLSAISGSPSHIISWSPQQHEAGASTNTAIFQGNDVLIR
ncbi:hypothetical protein VNO77_00430 [Canavalia gladiata]|uniref:RING-type E3 ubiquitin transferase n=1 Tax=Canavalia gladiata TaxID=3824 RepID=A0AAN9MQ09_CANGL